nr:hypothetical protein [Enhydrobacter sp. 8BJ]
MPETLPWLMRGKTLPTPTMDSKTPMQQKTVESSLRPLPHKSWKAGNNQLNPSYWKNLVNTETLTALNNSLPTSS